MFASVFGKKKQAENLQVPVIYDGRLLGEVIIGIDPRDKLQYLASEDFLLLIQPLLNEYYFNQIKHLQSTGEIPLGELELLEFKAIYDVSRLEVHIDFPPEKSKVEVKGYGKNIPHWVNHVETPELFSAYVNYLLSSTWRAPIHSEVQRKQKLSLEPVINLLGVIFETDIELVPSEETDWSNSALSYDDEANAIRYSLGELNLPTTSFQGAIPFAGFSLERKFELQPYNNVKPRNRQEFILQERSVVTVFVNGRRVDKLTLEAGKHSIEDLALAEGNNAVRIEIEGFSGKFEVLEFNLPVSSKLLREHVSEFSFAFGFPNEFAAEGRSYDVRANSLILSAFYNQGLTSDWTLGGFAQGDSQGWMAGLDSTTATLLGNFSFEIAFSQKNYEGKGFKSRTRYDYLFKNSYQSRISLEAEHTSTRFYNLDQNAGDSMNAGFYSVIVSSSVFGGASGSVSATYNDKRGDDISDNLTFNFQLSKSWVNNLRTVISLDLHNNQRSNKWEKQILFSLNLALPQWRQHIAHNYDSQTDIHKVRWNRRPENELHDIDLNASITRGKVQRTKDISARYRNRFVDTAASFSDQRVSGDRNHDKDANVQISGALAFNTQGIGFSRRINDSYAMIITNEHLVDQSLGVNPYQGGMKHESYAGDYLPAMVPDLVSYRYSRVFLDGSTLKQGNAIDRELYIVKPGYKSAYVFSVGEQASLIFSSRLVDQTGKALGLTVGRYYREGQSQSSQSFFTNRKGKFVIEGMMPGKYIIEIDNLAHDPLIIEIPDSAQKIYRIKTISVEVKRD